MNNYLKAIIIVVITGLLTGVGYLLYENNRITTISGYNISAYQDTIRSYEIKIDSLSHMVSEKMSLVMSQKEAIRQSLINQERLKKTNISVVATNIKLVAEINTLKDSLNLPPTVIFVTVKDTSGSYDAIKIPYEWEYVDKHLYLKTGIREDKTAFFDMKTTLDGEITIGYNKGIPKAIMTTTNPYVVIKDMTPVIISNPTPFYKKWWFPAIVGGLTVGIIGIAL
jgi:hypothetical protein